LTTQKSLVWICTQSNNEPVYTAKITSFLTLVYYNPLELDNTSGPKYTNHMDATKKQFVFAYLQEQIAQAEFRAKAYVFDDQNAKNPKRNCYVKLRKYLNDFLEGQTEARWIAIAGFRGVGKTTLLSQLYYETSEPGLTKLFLSIDHLTQILGISLSDALIAYEELLGSAFERLDKPVILFLDEVQYDPKWAITLKTLFDRTKKVFMLCTGSSAVTLQTNPDVARRLIFERLYPMSFTEYIKIKDGKFEIKGLTAKLRTIIFQSTTPGDVFIALKHYEQDINRYWTGIERLEIDRYMKYGTLPFAVKLKNEGLVYDQIKKILDRVVSMDIPQLGQFRPEITAKIPEILYAVAASDMLSVTNLAKDIGIDRLTLTQILATLEKTETLTRIYPYGAHATQVRKPSKYLFASPAFRSMYYHVVGNIIGEQNYKGKLLEDTIGLYLTRILTNNGSLTYDSSEGGADFIIRLGNQTIVLETGIGEKAYKQIEQTSGRIGQVTYGLVVSNTSLSLSPDKKTVSIPLHYFFLL
jgi:uncharacterized protein